MEILPPVEDQCEEIEEITMSIIKSWSKNYKPLLYDEAVNNPICNCKWREAIKKELQNLEDYQIWKYNKLSLGQKAIRLK